jgi:hypothetical protein
VQPGGLPVIELSRYVLKALRKDEEFILYRGRSKEGASQVLVLSPVGEYPTPESLKRLEHECSLREELHPAWAARPIMMARHWDRSDWRMDASRWHSRRSKYYQSYAGIITPEHGTAPVRIATRDFNSFFLGAIHGVWFWNRALTASEVQMAFTNVIPPDGLVAEHLLEQDLAPDTTGLHDGQVVGGLWTTP